MKVDSKMHLAKVTCFFLSMLCILLACNGQKKAAADDIDEQVSDSPLTLIMQENYAGTDTVATHIIESQKSLAKFFAKINMTRKPGIPVPQVDFSKDLVVIYCSGNQGNGTKPLLGLSAETDSELVLEMSNKKDDETSATVSPFSIYKMPLTSKKINFKAVE